MLETDVLVEYPCLPEDRETIVHVLIKLETDPLQESRERLPLNVALVLDRSGSMSGGKLDSTKKAAKHLIDRLQKEDKISIVVYDDTVDVLSPPVDGSQKDRLAQALNGVTEGGSTNLSGGWLSGLSLVGRSLSEQRLHRVLLLTDGLPNAGVMDHAGLISIGTRHLEKGIHTTTLGFGADFNEDLLMAIAEQSGGNFYYIDTPDKAPEAFVTELGELAAVLGQNLEVIVRCEPGVTVARNYCAFPGVSTDEQVLWRVGDLYADDMKLLLLSLKIPAGFAHGPKAVAHMGLRYHDVLEGGKECRREAPVMVTFSTEEAASKQANEEVRKEVLVMGAARAKEQAVAFADVGKFAEAREALALGSKAIRRHLESSPPLSPEDAELLRAEAGLCDELLAGLQRDQYDASSRKQMTSLTYEARTQRGSYRRKGTP
jgi:Ca-activated chloride channel homolog